MTTQPPHSPETSSGTNLIADSRITMYKVVTSAFVNAQDVLDPGVILMWMDIAACLAAERHTKTSSVTLSMDDLHFDTMVRLGATVRLEATLHKVFGTSMEVGCTVSTSQPSGRDKFVCAACFTFVALGTDGKKMRVAEALAVTPEEKFLSTIATERRAWRLKRSALELEAREGAELSQSLDVAIEEDAVLSGGCAAGGSCCEGGVEEAVPMPLVTFSMTQLVLPNMANHHGNTFGGQVMAWMAEAATVAANRQAIESVPASHLGAISHVEIALVDALQFHAKSVVGDRVVLHAKVTRVFGSSMEICVTVEAYGATSTEVHPAPARPIHSTAYSRRRGFSTLNPALLCNQVCLLVATDCLPHCLQVRHINTGYLTIHVKAQKRRGGRYLDVPLRPSRAPPATELEAHAAHAGALVRLRVRVQRRQMLSLRSDAMTWSPLLTGAPCV